MAQTVVQLTEAAQRHERRSRQRLEELAQALAGSVAGGAEPVLADGETLPASLDDRLAVVAWALVRARRSADPRPGPRPPQTELRRFPKSSGEMGR